MKYLKLYFILFLLFITYIILSAKSYSTFISNSLSDEIFRLHIVANSNSAEDQYLKLQIRDNIIKYMNDFYLPDMKKEDIISLINNKKEDISKIIKDTINNNGYDYNFSFNIEKCEFPTKTYGNISLPSGNYDCLNIKIGNSVGENWWCVMFPPVCLDNSTVIIDKSSEEILSNSLNEESFNVISSSKKEYKVKFKILEIFNSL